MFRFLAPRVSRIGARVTPVEIRARGIPVETSARERPKISGERHANKACRMPRKENGRERARIKEEAAAGVLSFPASRFRPHNLLIGSVTGSALSSKLTQHTQRTAQGAPDTSRRAREIPCPNTFCTRYVLADIVCAR